MVEISGGGKKKLITAQQCSMKENKLNMKENKLNKSKADQPNMVSGSAIQIRCGASKLVRIVNLF